MIEFDAPLLDLAAALLADCRARRAKIATAESCTGGLIAATLTSIAGCSDVFDRAFITYSNEAKTELLGVPPGLIASCGAVSEGVARRMAAGALRRSSADLAVAVTGIAGPGGGTAEKPVGLVWFGAQRRSGAALSEFRVFRGDRQAIRDAATRHGLLMLRRVLEGE